MKKNFKFNYTSSYDQLVIKQNFIVFIVIFIILIFIILSTQLIRLLSIFLDAKINFIFFIKILLSSIIPIGSFIILPVSLLTLIFITQLNAKTHQTLITSGISKLRIALPYFLFIFFVSIFTYLININLEYKSYKQLNNHSKNLIISYIKSKNVIENEKSFTYYSKNKQIYLIGLFSKKNNIIGTADNVELVAGYKLILKNGEIISINNSLPLIINYKSLFMDLPEAKKLSSFIRVEFTQSIQSLLDSKTNYGTFLFFKKLSSGINIIILCSLLLFVINFTKRSKKKLTLIGLGFIIYYYIVYSGSEILVQKNILIPSLGGVLAIIISIFILIFLMILKRTKIISI